MHRARHSEILGRDDDALVRDNVWVRWMIARRSWKTTLNRCLELNPGNKFGWFNLASVKLAHEDFNGAEAFCLEALRLDGAFPEAHSMLTECRHAMKDRQI